MRLSVVFKKKKRGLLSDEQGFILDPLSENEEKELLNKILYLKLIKEKKKKKGKFLFVVVVSNRKN